MTTWTEAARAELERYFERVRPGMAADGADPAEVCEDIRQHLEREAVAARLEVVTGDDVRRLLQRIGAPQPPETNPTPNPAERVPSASPAWFPAAPGPATAGPAAGPFARAGYGMLVAFGAVLPAVTLLIEWITGMCAATFFDPMPTLWHGLLVALVPAANTWALVALARRDARHRRWLGWANGIAFGICCYYTLRFAPLLLPGLFAVILFGWGLLPWSPALGLVSTVFLRRRLRGLGGGGNGLPGFWRGLGLAWVALLLVDSPVYLTRLALQMAAADEPATQQRGLRWLRAVGDDEVLLRECYGRTPTAANMDVVGWVIGGDRPVRPELAREIYYRVTGEPFNAVPAPRVRTARGGPWAGLDDWTWDTDQGGERVGGRIKGLRLRSSRLDAVLEGNAGLAYTEWTLEFQNDSPWQREARMQVQLPPGGVVSRLSLWVNGEEREAAFAGRTKVREAYQQVAIQQRRDPVLVTTAGPDRVLVQCFPVPPTGGVMRVRLGVTAPLVLTTPAEGVFRWPCFLERNFTLAPDLRHSLWAEAQEPLTASDRLHAEQPKERLFAVRGQLLESQLQDPLSLVRVRRDPQVRSVWTRDAMGEEAAVVRQEWNEVVEKPPQRLVVVVDGSKGMRGHLSAIAAALTTLPDTLDVRVVMAADEVTELGAEVGGAGQVKATRAAALQELTRWPATGGQDNVPALVRAWELASERPGGAVLWIHRAQPVLLGSVEPLRQAYERRPMGPVIHEFTVEPVPNRVLEQLDGLTAIQSVPRLGGLEEDLRQWIAGMQGTRRMVRGVLERRTGVAEGIGGLGPEVTSHLARLWAMQEVQRLQKLRQLVPAARLAARYQLVTPVSGAVVLETEAQYQATGLTPVDPMTVPAIPEPSTWSLLTLGLAWLWWRESRTPRRPRCATR